MRDPNRIRVAGLGVAVVVALLLQQARPTGQGFFTFERVSLSETNAQMYAGLPGSMSADGRYVLFKSWKFQAGNAEPLVRWAVRDRTAGTTSMFAPDPARGIWDVAVLSADGGSLGTLDTIGETNNFVHIRDRATGARRWTSGDIGFPATIAISGDGTRLAFDGFYFGPTVPALADPWDQSHVYVHDLLTGITRVVSAASDGTLGNNTSNTVGMSADGKWVAFTSLASNLVPGDTNQTRDTFLVSLESGVVTRLATATSFDYLPVLSADGRYVVIKTPDALDPSDTNQFNDLYLYDRDAGSYTLINAGRLSIMDEEIWGHATAISGDGRTVLYTRDNAQTPPEMFRRDLQTGTTLFIALGGATAGLSDDGCHALIGSVEPLVPGDTNGNTDAFIASLAGCGPAPDRPNLRITKGLTGPGDVRPGEAVIFGVTVLNGVDAAGDPMVGVGPTTGPVTVTDVLPAGLVFEPLVSSSDCTASGSAVTCVTASLAAGTFAQFTIATRVADGAAAPGETVSLSNTASVTTPDEADSADNTSAPVPFTVRGPLNTPEGLAILVQAGPTVTVVFDRVTAAGQTTATDATAPALPNQFRLLGTAIDITTTATYAGPVTVCFAGTFTAADRMLHFENGAWVDVTTSQTPTEVCGTVLTLSPFAVATRLDDPLVLNRVVPSTVVRGLVVPLLLQGDGFGHDLAIQVEGQGVRVLSVHRLTRTLGLAVVHVMPNAPRGARLLTVSSVGRVSNAVTITIR